MPSQEVTWGVGLCLPSCLSRDCCHFAAMHARPAVLCASEDFLSFASFLLIGALRLQMCVITATFTGILGV